MGTRAGVPQDIAGAIRALRGGQTRPRLQAPSKEISVADEEEPSYDPDNIERLLRAALEATGAQYGYNQTATRHRMSLRTRHAPRRRWWVRPGTNVRFSFSTLRTKMLSLQVF